MNRRAALGLLAAPLVRAQAPPELNRLSAAEKAAGWMLLFDGKTLNGWQDPRKLTPPSDAWAVDDECIHALPKPKMREDLLSTETFGDFDLVFEWKVAPGSNSGFKYLIQDRVFLDSKKTKPGANRFEETVGYELVHRVGDRSHPLGRVEDYLISFEYQVIDDAGHPDARRGTKYAAGSLYSFVGPVKPMAKPVGQFNLGRVVRRGKRVEHWLNGVKVVDTSLDSDAVKKGVEDRWHGVPEVANLLLNRPKSVSPVALQNHNDEAWFRNIRIRRL